MRNVDREKLARTFKGDTRFHSRRQAGRMNASMLGARRLRQQQSESDRPRDADTPLSR